MRIGYFADGPWANRALEKIIAADRIDVAFVTGRHGTTDQVLSAKADAIGVPFYSVANVNSAEFLELVRSHAVDLNVSMSYDQIIREPLRKLAPLGFVNCHAGALPFYRGRNILNWALINGETEFGVTVHHVDAGIDTGDIILQRKYPITPEDTYATVLDKAYVACADVVSEALCALRDGTAARQPQSEIHPVGFYCGTRRPGDEWIDWNWPSQRIHNFIRGICPPGPGARTLHESGELAITASSLIANAPAYIGTPGQVVGSFAASVVVKTGDSTLEVTRVAPVADGFPVETQYEAIPRFRNGTRFTSPCRCRGNLPVAMPDSRGETAGC